MKTKILFFVIFLFPAISFSQTKKDYILAMHQFQNFYNHHQPDSICYICQNPDINNNPSVLSTKAMDDLMKNFGELKSYIYVEGADNSNGVVVFKTDFSHSTQFMGISLDKNKKIVKLQVIK